VVRIKDRLVERGAHNSVGGNVFFGYAPTLWDAKKGNPIGSNDRFYPGDGVFDLFCPTSYNWYNWNIGDGKWHTFESVMWEAADLARRRGQKLFPSETGCHPAADGFDRNQWLRDARIYMETNDWARSVIVGFVYFGVEFMDAGQWAPRPQPGAEELRGRVHRTRLPQLLKMRPRLRGPWRGRPGSGPPWHRRRPLSVDPPRPPRRRP
jgi:hypothetical protein